MPTPTTPNSSVSTSRCSKSTICDSNPGKLGKRLGQAAVAISLLSSPGSTLGQALPQQNRLTTNSILKSSSASLRGTVKQSILTQNNNVIDKAFAPKTLNIEKGQQPTGSTPLLPLNEQIEIEWDTFRSGDQVTLTTEGLKNTTQLSQLITDHLGYQKIENYLYLLSQNNQNQTKGNSRLTISRVTLSNTTAEIEHDRLTSAAAKQDQTIDFTDNNAEEQLEQIDDNALYVRVQVADNRSGSRTTRPCTESASISFDGPKAGKIAKLFMQIYQFGSNRENNFQAQMINLALSHGENYPIHLSTLSGNRVGFNLGTSPIDTDRSGIYVDPDDDAEDLALTLIHEVGHDLHIESRDKTNILDGTGIFRDTGTTHSREQMAFSASVLIEMFENGIDYLQNIDQQDYSANLFLIPLYLPQFDNEVDGHYRSNPPDQLKVLQSDLTEFFKALVDVPKPSFTERIQIREESLEKPINCIKK